MGLDELQPGNTLRAKVTARAACTKFIEGEDVEEECIRSSIAAIRVVGASYVSWISLECILQIERQVAGAKHCNAVLSPDRNMIFPLQRALLEPRLLDMGRD